jgi:ribosomal protein S28E/S33
MSKPAETGAAETGAVADEDPIRVAVKCRPLAGSDLPRLVRPNVLGPGHITVGELLCWIRHQLRLPPEKALFVTMGDGYMPPMSTTMSALLLWTGGDEGHIRVIYCSENVFG